jgi:hypothetical protein
MWKKLQLKKVSMLCAGIIFSVLMLNSCANRRSALDVSFYSFKYEGENYRIRSISSKSAESSFNELISKQFVAKDYDQDGFIDEITLGEIPLSEAQTIYEYTLKQLTKQNKLREVNPQISVYQYVNSEYNYEVKSFRPSHAEPFNQFKVFKNGRLINPEFIISIDQNADGTLDGIVKGTMALEKIQMLYSDVIKRGLESNDLIKIGNMILVRQ